MYISQLSDNSVKFAKSRSFYKRNKKIIKEVVTSKIFPIEEQIWRLGLNIVEKGEGYHAQVLV